MTASTIASPRIQAPRTSAAPYRPEISVCPEPATLIVEVPVKRTAVADVALPTLNRPTLGAARLFQGWGPRLG
jgi:hypothetical protein